MVKVQFRLPALCDKEEGILGKKNVAASIIGTYSLYIIGVVSQRKDVCGRAPNMDTIY